MQPEIKPPQSDEIVPNHVRLVQALYTAQLLDSVRLYDVVDRIVELFKQGQLRLARGPVVQAIADYAFDSTRLTAAERQTLYRRTLGVAPEASAPTNAGEFANRWLDFMGAVSDYARIGAPAGLLWPRAAANARVRRSARALALWASRTGAEAAAPARTLRETTERQFSLLGAAQLLAALGAREPWQVVDRINRLHLGGSVDVTRVRALQRAAGSILSWLATWGDGQSQLLGDSAAAEQPSHEALVDAVAAWLAAAGFDANDLAPPDRPRELATDPVPEAAAIRRSIDELAALARIRSRGIGALFMGPAGSGKSASARAVAEAAGRPLHRADLAPLLGGHIEETEQALNVVFDDAERAGAVLLFEDAEALFDHAAATPTPALEPLLQRIGAHTGVVIIEVRNRVVPDADALRRLRVVLDFGDDAAGG